MKPEDGPAALPLHLPLNICSKCPGGLYDHFARSSLRAAPETCCGHLSKRIVGSPKTEIGNLVKHVHVRTPNTPRGPPETRCRDPLKWAVETSWNTLRTLGTRCGNAWNLLRGPVEKRWGLQQSLLVNIMGEKCENLLKIGEGSKKTNIFLTRLEGSAGILGAGEGNEKARAWPC